MQSYFKYKAYYDRKAKAAPLETTDYCYILNPKADTQATKKLFREIRWRGPFKVEKVLPNNNYIVRRLGNNETEDTDYTPIKMPENRRPPPVDLQKIVGRAQWNRPIVTAQDDIGPHSA